LGTVVLKPLSPNAVKLRQMAVAQECRGKGIGRELLLWAECTAFARGLLDIELHARVSARGFYEKVGYQDAGAVFIELGSVPTIKMLKCIQTEPS
jgi:GNAT superfamily N-acetyltransferase